MLSGFIGAIIGVIAVLVAVFVESYLQRRHEHIWQFKQTLFSLYSELDHFRSNHSHIVKWDEDKDRHRDLRGYPGYCENEHPNYPIAVDRFKARRYEIVDLLRTIKTAEVWRFRLDEGLSARIINAIFAYSFATEAERQKELVACVDQLRREWLTIDKQVEEVSATNKRLRESDEAEYARRFRLVEGPDEDVY